MINVAELCKLAKASSYNLGSTSPDNKNAMLKSIIDEVMANIDLIILQNNIDVKNLKGKDSAFLDRLTLNKDRVVAMCKGLEQICLLDDPIGEVVEEWSNSSGLTLRKVRASLGVVAVIYEARPNVTIDVAGLCIKTGNAVVLKGGSDAINSNRILFQCVKNALDKSGYDSDIVQFIDDTNRESTDELLKQSNTIDVIIPRGGNQLKDMVLAKATMPVIASAGGNCHIYVDSSADLDMAIEIIINAKTQRPTVCNACEQLLIASEILPIAVPKIFKALSFHNVNIKADKECIQYYDCDLATDSDYYTEHLELLISVKSVQNIDEAIDWINCHSTSHSEAIISKNQANIDRFCSKVDSGCIYVNASTRFTDGFEFGFGAEIGISTQKLHARGPLGLRQLTSEKYIVVGNGTIRK